MSTFENPDAAPGVDSAPETVDAQATALPPVPETSAADAAQSAATARLDDIPVPTAAHVAEASTVVDVTPSAATEADGTAALADLTPTIATDADADAAAGVADARSALADLEPPAPAPAALPPAYTGFEPAPGAASVALVSAATDAAPSATDSAAPSGPRTRWAAIVWGLVLAAIASLALWLLTATERQAAATDWILNLTPAAVIAYSVLVIGAFALVAGLVGLVRRAQRAAERPRAASTSAV